MKITGTFLDEITHDIPSANWGPEEWAADFDANTWAQFMLKFVVAHPAVTLAAPGTGDPGHMIDNLGGGKGRMPTPDHLRRMAELVESLPQAG